MLGQTGSAGCPKKDGATRFKHAAPSLFSPPNEGVDIQGNRAQARFPNRKELSSRGMVRVCGSDGPFPGEKFPESRLWRHWVRWSKDTPLVEPWFLCSSPAIGSFIRKPVAGSGVNAAKRLPLQSLGKAEGPHLQAGSPRIRVSRLPEYHRNAHHLQRSVAQVSIGALRAPMENNGRGLQRQSFAATVPGSRKGRTFPVPFFRVPVWFPWAQGLWRNSKGRQLVTAALCCCALSI